VLAPLRCLSQVRRLATATALENPLEFLVREAQVQEAVHELIEGNGFYVLKGGFSRQYALAARERILELVRLENSKATHFTAQGQDKQKRVWNVMNKGDIFIPMVQHPFVMAVFERILGDDFALGSIATNTLLPGATGQEPHLDYPYWDYHDRKHWPQKPKTRDMKFIMNCQATILLDTFTALNGATGCIPGSQVEAQWPDRDSFFKNVVQVDGEAGDVMLFTGLLQHAAMPNKDNHSRTGLLLQYLPKYVKPMEDMVRLVRPDIITSATPRLRQLLAIDYPYPANLDDSEAVNAEGATAKKVTGKGYTITENTK
jgi:hypothetical protein